MTDAQRIDYLVAVLEGGNAKAFADKAGMHQQTVTGLRQGAVAVGPGEGRSPAESGGPGKRGGPALGID